MAACPMRQDQRRIVGQPAISEPKHFYHRQVERHAHLCKGILEPVRWRLIAPSAQNASLDKSTEPISEYVRGNAKPSLEGVEAPNAKKGFS